MIKYAYNKSILLHVNSDDIRNSWVTISSGTVFMFAVNSTAMAHYSFYSLKYIFIVPPLVTLKNGELHTTIFRCALCEL